MKVDENMPAKVCRTLESTGKQSGAANGPKRVSEKFFGHTVRWQGCSISDRDVRITALEIYDCVSADDLQRQRATLLAPERQAGHEPSAGKGIRRCYSKRLLLAVALHSCDSLSERFKPIANDWKQARSRLSQRQWSRPTTEQRSAAISLKQPYLMADRRRRDVKLVCCLLEAHVSRCRLEGT
jgi:hypothetical protein